MARAKNWLIRLVALSIVASTRLAAAQSASSSTLDWQPTDKEAIRIAAQTNRLVLVHFYSPSDQACQMIERNIYSQPAVRDKIQAKFVPFKLNVEESPLTAKLYGVDRIPSDFVLNADGVPMDRFVCPLVADAYLTALDLAAAKVRPTTQAQNVVATTSTAAPPAATAPATTTPIASTPAASAQSTLVAEPAPYQASAPSPTTTSLAYNQEVNVEGATTAAQSPAQKTPPQPPAIPAYSDDRYAEFFQRWNAGQKAASQAPVASQPVTPTANSQLVQAPVNATAQPSATAPPSAAPFGSVSQPITYAGNAATSADSSNAQLAAGAASPSSTAMPVGVPPLGLEGYCPVTLIEQNRWQVGDRRWGAVHRGRTYLFTGPMEQKQFLADPDRYSPAISGRDVVAALDRGQSLEGQRQFGVKNTDGRMYLFATAINRDIFIKNANRYSAEVKQAENPNRTTTWR
ncbi:MAG: DUF255 domain-containing protein [Pirellulales bacterium]|nr:DUF255 domain-containing protein [Pirellulales bacterium]